MTKIKKFNGSVGVGRSEQTCYVATTSWKRLTELLNELFHENASLNYVRDYWSPCWGINPPCENPTEEGVWVQDGPRFSKGDWTRVR